jgi:hypothetical protein
VPLDDDVEPADEVQHRSQVADLLSRSFERDYPPSVRPALRDQHARSHGCVRAEFVVEDDLPSELRHGLFAVGGRYPAWIRFSAASPRPQPDTRRDARGMAIKMLGVPGPIIDADRGASNQDFVLGNSAVFFCRNVEDYVELTEAVAEGRLLRFFFPSVAPWRWRPVELLNMVNAIRRRVEDPLAIRYWSQTPYALGPWAVKYSAAPAGAHGFSGEGPDRLRRAMVARLAGDDASFDFLVQIRVDRRRLPVDDPTRVWSERRSPFVKVATCRIPSQHFDTPERAELDEQLSFSPWHCHADHRPLGSINRVRRTVYELIARRRNEMNGVWPTRPDPMGQR